MKKNIILLLLIILIINIYGCAPAGNIVPAKTGAGYVNPFSSQTSLILYDTAKVNRAVFLYEKGLKAEKEGLLDQAITNFSGAIESAPDYFDAIYSLAKVYNKNGSREKALDLYKKAIHLKPDIAKLYNETGDIYRDMNKLDSAIESYQKAIDIDPALAESYANLGLMYSTRKYIIEKAVYYYNKAIDLNNDPHSSAISHFQLGMINFFKNNEQIAINQFKLAINKLPDYAPPYFKLGEIYFRKEEEGLAIEMFEKYIKLADTKNDQVIEAKKYLKKLDKMKITNPELKNK
ncbi:tetratricopeptide repeat protein [Candidatus Desantisbacteria bacterium]|nr:tetratricopeptide repeat protein [Candidatus Desantisbacteria bacterium]